MAARIRLFSLLESAKAALRRQRPPNRRRGNTLLSNATEATYCR